MRRFCFRLLAPAFLLCAHNLAAQNFNFQLHDQLDYPVKVSNLWAYTDGAGNEYALVGPSNGLSIVNVSNPDDISEVFFVPTANSDWHEIKTWNQRAYVTNETGGGLLIVNLSQLPDTVTYHYYTDNGLETAHTIWIDENGIMYLFGYNTDEDLPQDERGAMVFDLNADPDVPQLLGTYNDMYIHDGFVRGDTLWAGSVYDGQLAVLDVTDKTDFQLMALQTTPLAFTHNAWPTSDNQYVFTTDEKANSTLAAYDVSDLQNITLVDEAQSNPGSNSVVHNVHLVNNDFAAASYYRDGVTIFDVSQPDNMILVGSYDTSPDLVGDGFNGNWGVYPYLASGIWLASDIENGLFVFTPTLQKAAHLQGTVTNASTTLPLNNVNVYILSTDNSDQTDFNGVYKTGNAQAGTYNVKFEAPGYAPLTLSATLVNDSTVILDAALIPLEGFTLTVHAVDALSGNDVPSAQVFVTDYGLYQHSIATDAAGFGNATPTYESEYDAIAGAWGYRTQSVSLGLVNVNSDTVTLELTKGYYDDFYFDFGWTATQTATDGHWTRGVPAGTWFDDVPTNPNSDVVGDFGATAFVTGNAGGNAGDDDVDAGEVMLTSPVFDLTAYTSPFIRYTRWFANGGGQGSPPNDSLIVKLDNGNTTAVLEVVTAQQNLAEISQWITKTFKVADFVTPTNNMKISFRAADAEPGHLVEAALDVFEVIEESELNVITTKENNGWLLYPNPAADQLQLFSSVSTNGFYKIVSVTGAELTSGPLNHNAATVIDTQLLSGGYYFIVIESESQRSVLPFIKL